MEFGQLSRYDLSIDEWREWPLPGDVPQAYAVYVDELDYVWVTDFGGTASTASTRRPRPSTRPYFRQPTPR